MRAAAFIDLGAFADELVKLAGAPVVEKHQDFTKLLRPGDLLITKPRKTKGLVDKAVRVALVGFQGTPWTHVAMYAGNGRVIDANQTPWRGYDTPGIRNISMKTFSDTYKARALRVRASASEKKDAVEFSKKQVGKEFNTAGLLRLALPTWGEAKQRLRDENKDSLFCSEMVANAYPNVSFRNRKTHHVRPVDIAISANTKRVAELA